MRVLIAEDDPISRRLLESVLRKWGHEPITATDGKEAWRILGAADAPKLAILDWMMPGLDGIEVCRQLRLRGDAAYVYVLLLTARARTEDMVEGLEAGADDYVVKPFDAGELRARLHSAERILALQQDLRKARDAYRHQATHDALTKLWNRPAILDALDRELDRSRRENTTLGILMADLDRFKQVNDRLGHRGGDEALRESGRRMSGVLRPYDAIGRYGGEEFLVVCPQCGPADIAEIGERVRTAVSQSPPRVAGSEIGLTVSVGAATSQADSTEGGLIRAADQALYRAKEAGRDRLMVFDDEAAEPAAA